MATVDTVGVKYEGDVSNLKKQLDSLIAENKRLLGQVDGLGKEYKESAAQGATAVKQLDKETEKLKSSTGQVGGVVSKLGPMLVAAFSTAAIIAFGKQVFDITAKFQKYAAVLTNTLGSKSDAQKALVMIQDFASKTPFSIDQLTGSFVKLANQGFTPTQEEMRKLGDLAAAMGKDFDQLTEAIIDAQTGEFERLKEFGIRAQKEGDKVTFTFKGVKTQTDFTADAMRNYVLSLGDLAGVSGGMAAISETLGGKTSNLGDQYDMLQATIGERLTPAFNAMLGAASGALSVLEDWLEVPLSEKLQDEQIQLLVTQSRINDYNTSATDRVKLIQQLQAQYPDYLGKLDAELVTNEELNMSLNGINDALATRIVLQRQGEEVADAQEDLADAMEAALVRESALREDLAEWAIENNFQLKQGVGIQEQLADAMSRTRVPEELVELNLSLGRAQKNQVKAQGDVNELLQERLELQKRLGVNGELEEDRFEAEAKRIGAINKKEADAIEAKQKEWEKGAEKRKKAAEKLEQDLLKMEFETQSLRIDLMTDGIGKQLALRNLAFEKEKNQYRDNKKALLLIEEAYQKDIRKIIDSYQIKRIDAGEKVVEKVKTQREKEIEEQNKLTQLGFENWKAQQDQKKERVKMDADDRLAIEENTFAAISSLGEIFIQDQQKLATFQKAIALFQIGIDTAKAISAGIAASAGVPFPANLVAITTTIATVLANIATAKGILSSAPAPAFKEGVIDLQGPGTETSDSIHARLSKRESVMTAQETKKYKEELLAMRAGNFDELMLQKYVMPALQRDKSTASNMANSFMLNHLFDDSRIVGTLEKNKPATAKDIKRLGSDISKGLEKAAYKQSKMWKNG